MFLSTHNVEMVIIFSADDDFITASEGEDEKPTSLPPQTVKIIGESHDQSDSDIRSTTKVAMKFNLSQV